MSLGGKWFGFGVDEVYEEGLAAFDRGDFENAVEAFEACVAADDEALSGLARLNLTQCNLRLGRPDAAVDKAAWSWLASG